ncbi:MAG: 16S rRNA processing protein RimM [Prevotella sp.]|nr:16S rRNA processing protein RimM [Prevotella sp.]
MIRQEEVFKIGRLGKPHGVRGEINLQTIDDTLFDTEAEYVVLMIDGILVPFYFEEYRWKNDETVLAKFCDIDTQERAAELTGCDVFFPRSIAESASEEGNVSWAQIVGYALLNTYNNMVGRIAAVDDQTINLLFELEDGRLIPANEQLIHNIDTEKREITMEIAEGLLDL